MHQNREQIPLPFPSSTREILADERGTGTANLAGLWAVPTAEEAEARRLFCSKRLRRFKDLP